MDLRVKVKCDGNHMIGSLPMTGRRGSHARKIKTHKEELFDVYYKEALEQKIKDKQICEYIQDRFVQEQEFEDWISDEEVKALYKNKLRNKHKRLKRYKDKLYFTPWNYFVTFTYDDNKETEESFLKRLKKVFSNLKTRNGWRIIAVTEEGGENGRKHVHAFVYVPEGAMKGELFANKLWSKKKRRWTYFTDNTYFNKRFGHSVWEKIDSNDLRNGGLSTYLSKYLEKSGTRFFYSRGIPDEIDMVIDTETDVCCTFYRYGYKVLLFDFLFYKSDAEFEDDEATFDIGESKFFGFNLENCMVLP